MILRGTTNYSIINYRNTPLIYTHYPIVQGEDSPLRNFRGTIEGRQTRLFPISDHRFPPKAETIPPGIPDSSFTDEGFPL